jgi:hypothetical protein
VLAIRAMRRARAGAGAEASVLKFVKATHRVRRDRVDASTRGLTVKPERLRQSESGRVPEFTTTTIHLAIRPR